MGCDLASQSMKIDVLDLKDCVELNLSTGEGQNSPEAPDNYTKLRLISLSEESGVIVVYRVDPSLRIPAPLIAT